MRLTLDEYSKQFKMSREMIGSKLKAKKLNYIIENEVTYIIVTQKNIANQVNNDNYLKTEPETKTKKEVQKPRTTVAMVLGLYQKENQHLKDKIVQLENKIDKLIEDKEQMLRDEMKRIEQVYSAKDEQLKSILELMNSKLLLETNSQTIHDVQSIEKVETPKGNTEIIELRQYLKSLDLKAHQRKVIKKRFLASTDDIRIIKQNGKLFLDLSKYDYSDLLFY